jgi:hypothetical protein
LADAARRRYLQHADKNNPTITIADLGVFHQILLDMGIKRYALWNSELDAPLGAPLRAGVA